MSTTTKPVACKYLAFDIETAKELPGDFSLWRNHRPLGICLRGDLRKRRGDAETLALEDQ